MVSPHLAPSCWGHSMPRSHCCTREAFLKAIQTSHWLISLWVCLSLSIGDGNGPAGQQSCPWSLSHSGTLILWHAELEPILWAFFLLDLISSWWLTSESVRAINYPYSPLNLANTGLCVEQRNYTWMGRGKAVSQIEGTAPRAHCIATTFTHWKIIIKIHPNHVSFVVLSKLNKCSFTAW